MSQQLYRSRKNRMLAGVCAGLAERMGIDPTMARLGYVMLALFSACFPGILIYIIMWIIIPDEPADDFTIRHQ